MTPRIHRPVAARLLFAALRTGVVIAVCATLAVCGTLAGCSSLTPSPDAEGARRESTPEAMPTSEAPSADLTFEAGASLAPDTDVGWGDGFAADPGWTRVPSEHPGRWSYVSASGACTAAFRGGVLGDAGGMDDREVTDALIEQQSGRDFLGAEMLEDGGFLLYQNRDARVEHRQFSYTVNDSGYFMAARAFVEPDYAVWVIVTCEGEPIGPVAQEVLSKNVIAVDAVEE